MVLFDLGAATMRPSHSPEPGGVVGRSPGSALPLRQPAGHLTPGVSVLSYVI